MKYHYFVSYFSSSNKDITQAFSTCEVTRNCKIVEYDDILELGKLLEDKFERKNVVILNYILLKNRKRRNEE